MAKYTFKQNTLLLQQQVQYYVTTDFKKLLKLLQEF